MGSIFLYLFFAWLFKGFGKAITHTDRQEKASYQLGWSELRAKSMAS